MAYILNSTSIARPKGMIKEQIEVAATVRTIGGAEKRDVTGYKNRYILTYEALPVADATIIRTIYDLKTVVTFESTEANFPVTSRDVLVQLSTRQYGYAGSDYLSNLQLILTEVDV